MSTTEKVSFTIRRPTPVSRNTSSGANSDAESNFKIPALPRHLNGSRNASAQSSPLASANNTPKRKKHRDSDDSSDEEEDVDEIVTGFDEFGVQRCVLFQSLQCSGSQLTAAFPSGNHFCRLKFKEPEGPLVIPALQNRDWRDARKRKAIFIPGGGQTATGADGSVGGLGIRDSINSGPQLSGLIRAEKRVKMEVDSDGLEVADILTTEVVTTQEPEVEEQTEDEKARLAILASLTKTEGDDGPTIDAIPIIGGNDWGRPESETEAYRRDVLTRPESVSTNYSKFFIITDRFLQASLDDYDRVPVSEFGAALLRGMGWKPGQAASRTRTGLVEPYLPAARPALLGIGAKERIIADDGSSIGKKGGHVSIKRPERKYVPVIKREKSPRRDERSHSRRSSRSPSSRGDRDREKDRERRRDYDDDRRKGPDYYSSRDKDYERRDSRRDYDDRDRQRARDEPKERRREKDRNRDSSSRN